MLVDTHCHLDFPEFAHDLEDVLQRAKQNGISRIINIGSSLEGSRRSLELSQKHDCIYATVGCHPHEADRFNQEIKEKLKNLAQKNKVVAIGETGLDYYKNYSQKENQKNLFINLLQLAKDLSLPLVVHSRQAEEEILKTLRSALPLRAVIHCFSGDEHFLNSCLDLGFFVSFTCNITYKKAENLRRLVEIAPLGRLMLETDAPFLPPEGLRGRRNEPLYVNNLCGAIAEIKQIDREEVARQTTANAMSFFNLS